MLRGCNASMLTPAAGTQSAEAHKESEKQWQAELAALQGEVASLTAQLVEAVADHEVAASLVAERDALLQAEAAQARTVACAWRARARA